MNKIVVHYADGEVEKGFTRDFIATRDWFHLISIEDQHIQTKIYLNALKALFFVKDFAGHPEHIEKHSFDPDQRVYGRKLKIDFKDGETYVGISQGYHPERIGFFLTPCDPESNTIRAFVINAFIKNTEFI